MRLIWIATMIAAVLGEAVSGCSCTKRPAIAPAPPKYVPAARPSGLEDSQLTYKDPASGIMIYVESDRRHIAAIDSTGKILWHKNLVVETGDTPSIYSLSQPSEEDLAGLKQLEKSGSFVGVSFNKRDRVLVDVQTGEYFKLGRD